ncbi:PhoH family protein [Abiotrophia sp.]|uniref:PhoH family protein n=1 Tax=Abiotrophia sp. TaxID=76631 RepID=UPI001CB2E550|nr:PhoH family protein [Abiotrophia sp.]MBF0942203.1 PhoH family protein [Abiotrophia sp.]
MTEQHPYSQTLIISNPDWLLAILGNQDHHVQLLEEHFEVLITTRGEQLTITGRQAAVELTLEVVNQLVQLLERHITPHTMDIVTAIKMAQNNTLDYFLNLYEEVIGRAADGRAIRVKNFGQLQYTRAIAKQDVVFGIGPAGTGKTFLAVVLAVQALKEGRVKKIILTRPAVEAGESLGFLPGDLKEKVDPYLRPVYDALYTIYGAEQTNRLMERGVIEIAPLAYMRGRTLDDAFVILDEAQNTTIAQMKMFLTRLGFGSKMIINGDRTQIDLPKGVKSGLVDAQSKLKGIDRIQFVTFDAFDVVRHPVVADIIKAYSRKLPDENMGEV